MLTTHSRFWQASWSFLQRDLKVRYASSALGFLWIFLYPLALIGITTAVFSFLFTSRFDPGVYTLHIIVGFVHWLFFSQSILKMMQSLQDNAHLVKNHAFPLKSLPASALLSRFVDYLVGLVILLIAAIFFGQTPSLGTLAGFMLALAAQLLLQSGLGLIFATLNAFVKDTQYLIEISLQLWFYATPVIYTLDMLPAAISDFLRLNPLAVFFTTYRRLIFGEAGALGSDFWIMTLISVIIFIFGWQVFKRNQRKFAELL